MKKRDMIRYLRQADAEDIAKNWPHPDDGAGERIYEKCRRSVEDLPEADTVQGETEIVQHTPVWRYAAAAAAVVLVVGGSVGGISLMQHMHSMEPLPVAEEQSTATVGSEPDTQAEPVFMEGIAEDRAATEPEKPQKPSEALAIVEHTTDASEPVTQAVTDASGNAAKATTPAVSTKPAKDSDPTEAADDHAARMDRAYELLMQFAEEHEHIEVYRTAREYFEAKTGVELKDLDDWVLVVYPCNYEDACLPAIEQFLKEKGIDDVAATYSGERESTRQTEGRITLAEAEQICRESAKAMDAAECIINRFDADEISGNGSSDWYRYYIDDAQTASINILYVHPLINGMCIFYQAPGESDSMDPQEHRILTAAGGQLGVLLNWQRLEMQKSDSVLTNDQKAQLRALEQEESSLWCIYYIRRRMEIIGAMSPDAPHLTLEDAEYICSRYPHDPEAAAKHIRVIFVPDYSWGSGVDGYAYVLSDHETINIVNGSSIYYEDTSTDPVTHRDLYE